MANAVRTIHNVTVEAPTNLNIKLVRADLIDTSHTFRTCFEFALSLFSALIGAILSMYNTNTGVSAIPGIYWVCLIILVAACLFFIHKSISVLKDEKDEKDEKP